MVSGGDIVNYEIDLKDCQQLAVVSKRLNKVTEGGVAGAAIGAAVGSIENGNDTLVGAVIGAIAGAAGGALISRKNQRDHIIQCMQQRGYNVVVDD